MKNNFKKRKGQKNICISLLYILGDLLYTHAYYVYIIETYNAY
jgi:hypothetical protein